ncbi:chitin synthase-domain-containing protein [Fimicolochytrium jonesii]|uniref:chitin synthase-domain-containing protein n=1 Tax=Fimicolochytrium jonesii TaxID=1396493 RepID=UPI0022FF35F9|nr:chitin synthase-domain-containing protein [Fimicolochytrium jonesii]KAI8819656.1 chitin synthase-domain-containing protein [Fimicolochytrium jonesii]
MEYEPLKDSNASVRTFIPEDLGGEGLGRTKTIKRVTLANTGAFVVDQPISKHVLHKATHVDGQEFNYMRYTACTSEPGDFSKGYTLRQRMFKRTTKVACVVTMYNEDDVLFAKSMYAVMKNIAYLCSDECPYSWGPDGWKNFVVVIVSDGRSKINPKVLTLLGVMGCYADGLAKGSVNGKDVKAHIFEYTTQVAINKDLYPRTDSNVKYPMVPMQTVFVLKEKNAKKINSHRWFFNAICNTIDPEVCFLLDVGTVPSRESFYHLYRAFERNENVGGACGEIKAELGPYWKNLINPLVASQNFEYKMSNILDKPLESVFGYISVLPGAFSAYRYKALQGAPLDAYFKGEELHGGADIFAANMYLAEDRILCFELVTKRNDKYVLRYCKDAHAETDVPDRLAELISQRRRWLNGSFFASLYAVWHWKNIFRSAHSTGRKTALLFEFFYNGVNLLFSWFALGNFYLAFHFLMQNVPFGEVANKIVSQIVPQLYLFALIAIFVSSLGNRPQGTKFLYHSLVIGFGLIMILMLFLAISAVKASLETAITEIDKPEVTLFHYFFTNGTFRDLVVSLLSTYGLYITASLAHADWYHMVTCLPQYLILTPTYINVFMIYAFCNLHDVSWGTKGDNAPDLGSVTVKTTASGEQVADVAMPFTEDDLDDAYEVFAKQLTKQREEIGKKEVSTVNAQTQQEDGYRKFRTRVVLSWVLSNSLLILIFTNEYLFPPNPPAVNPYLTFLFWSVAVLSAIRTVASGFFLVDHWRTKVGEKYGGRGHGLEDKV